MLCIHQRSIIHISCIMCLLSRVFLHCLNQPIKVFQPLMDTEKHMLIHADLCVCNVSRSEFNVSVSGCFTADSVVVEFNGSMRVFRWIMFMELQLKSFRSANRTVETVSDWQHLPLDTLTHTVFTYTLTGTAIIHTLLICYSHTHLVWRVNNVEGLGYWVCEKESLLLLYLQH